MLSIPVVVIACIFSLSFWAHIWKSTYFPWNFVDVVDYICGCHQLLLSVTFQILWDYLNILVWGFLNFSLDIVDVHLSVLILAAIHVCIHAHTHMHMHCTHTNYIPCVSFILQHCCPRPPLGKNTMQWGLGCLLNIKKWHKSNAQRLHRGLDLISCPAFAGQRQIWSCA